MHLSPPRDQARSVEGLVFVELRTVDGAGQDLARVERDLNVGGHDTEDLVRVEAGRGGGAGRGRAELAPVDPGHDGAAEADGVPLVGSQVVRQPGGPGVHLRATEFLVAGFLAGGHLHQRRAAEEHLGLAVHEHGVVAHAGHVRTARGGVAEDQGHGRDGQGRQLGQLVEDAPRGDEQVGLGGQVRAAGLDQVHHRQPVDPGDLQRAQRLAQRVGVHRAAADGRVVRDDHALDARDDADAGDQARTDGERGAPRGQGGQLEERAVPIEEQLDALTGQQPAAVTVPLSVPLAAAGHGALDLLLQLAEHGELGLAAGPVGLRAGIHVRGQDGHALSLRSATRAARGRGSSGSCRWTSSAARRPRSPTWAPCSRRGVP